MTHHQGFLYIADAVTGQTTELFNHARTFYALKFARLPQAGTFYAENLCEAYFWVPDCEEGELESVNFDGAAGISFPGVDGNYDSTPDDESLHITGPISIVVRKIGDIPDAGAQHIIGYGTTSGYPWEWRTLGGSTLHFRWTDSVTGTTRTITNGFMSLFDGWEWFAVTFEPDIGGDECRTRNWGSDDGQTWTILGSPSTDSPAATIDYDNPSDLVLSIADHPTTSLGLDADPVSVELRDGIGPGGEPGGTVVASRDYTQRVTSYTDPQGNEWQLQGTEWSWISNVIGAPWYDENIPASGDAIGFFIDEWTGLGSEHINSSVSELGAIGRGATIGPRTPGARTQSLNLTLFGANEEGLEHLFRWLEATLNSMQNPAATVELLTRLTCTADVDSWDGIAKMRRVAVLEGLHWIDPPLPRSGCVMRRANFVMAAEDPCMYIDRPESEVSAMTTELDRDDLNEIGFETCTPTFGDLSHIGFDSSIVQLDVPMDRPAVGAAAVDVQLDFDASWFSDGFIQTTPILVQVFADLDGSMTYYENMPLLGQVTFRGILPSERVNRLQLRYDAVGRQVWERSAPFVGWQPGWRWVAPTRGRPGPWWGSVTCHGFKVIAMPTDVCTSAWTMFPEFTLTARVGERISCP